MVGSNRPRPASPGHERPGRPPELFLGEPLPWEPIDGPDLTPPSSTIFVTGRVDVSFWSREKRAAFNRLYAAAEFFGLRLQEIAEGRTKRRSQFRRRVDLEYATDVILFAEGGIAFDEWVKSVYMVGMPATAGNLLAARHRAQVALYKISVNGDVAKRYDAEGNLILWNPLRAPPKEPGIAGQT